MAVQKVSGEAALVTAATGLNIFFVDRQQVSTGIDSLRGELSDYYTSFENIAINTACLLKSYTVGEEIATDQVTGTPADGTYLVAGTDGKVVAGTTGQVSYMISRGAFDDASNALYAIEFVNAHTC